MDDLRWTIYDGRFTMDDLRWTVYDGRFTIDDGRFTMDDLRWTTFPEPVEGWTIYDGPRSVRSSTSGEDWSLV